MLTRHFLFLFTISLSSCWAIPIQQQATFQQTQPIIIIQDVPSNAYIQNYEILNTLQDHYSAIVQDVVDTTVQEVMASAQDTFSVIHQLQWTGSEFCRVSVDNFIHVLDQELKVHVKHGLTVYVRPLIEKLYNQDESLDEFNSKLSQHLGLLLNPTQLSQDILNKVYIHQQSTQNIILKYYGRFFNKQWDQLLQHEEKEFTALDAWLRSWLVGVEFSLQEEFHDHLLVN